MRVMVHKLYTWILQMTWPGTTSPIACVSMDRRISILDISYHVTSCWIVRKTTLNVCILIQLWLNCVPRYPIVNKSALICMMVLCQSNVDIVHWCINAWPILTKLNWVCQHSAHLGASSNTQNIRHIKHPQIHSFKFNFIALPTHANKYNTHSLLHQHKHNKSPKYSILLFFSLKLL